MFLVHQHQQCLDYDSQLSQGSIVEALRHLSLLLPAAWGPPGLPFSPPINARTEDMVGLNLARSALFLRKVLTEEAWALSSQIGPQVASRMQYKSLAKELQRLSACKSGHLLPVSD